MRLNNDFILGSLLGFFLYHYFFIFTIGFASGIIVQENFGSVPTLLSWSLERLKTTTSEFYKIYITKEVSDVPEPHTPPQKEDDETFQTQIFEKNKDE